MENRIKQVRLEKKLTQTQFGKIIGVKGNTVTGYENGLRSPSDAVILSICREFDVNETWLRTGEGDMFIEKNRDQKIAEFIAEVMKDDDDAFKRRFVTMLSQLGTEEWEMLANMAKKMVED